MVRLDWINPQVGGLKGKEVYYRIVKAKTTFFDVLGTEKISGACERLRIDFLNALEQDRVHNLGFSKDTIVDELVLPFILVDPNVIEFELLEGAPKDGHCMDVSPKSIEDGVYRLRAYLDALREQAGDYVWDQWRYSRIASRDGIYFVESLAPFTVEASAFHEFLHTSHEAIWFGRKDGIIRPNIIALNAIFNLLEAN